MVRYINFGVDDDDFEEMKEVKDEYDFSWKEVVELGIQRIREEER